MIGTPVLRRGVALGACVTLTATGCAFHGLNSLPLPGTEGHQPGASVYHVEVANIGTLESNSPVLINDVVVGSVGNMRLAGWHIDVDVWVKPGIVIPANAVAAVGQTSLLGSMHLELNPPVGEAPVGRLPSGSTIALNRTMSYPSTEQTLSSLAAVVNGGGLGQIGDIVHSFNKALSGREGTIRDLLTRLDTVTGVLVRQRDNLLDTITELNRFAATMAGQQDVLSRALQRIPLALDVLLRERPRLTEAIEKLGSLGQDTAQVVNKTQDDLVTNLRHLGPTIGALADVGSDIDTALAYIPTFPLSQNIIDRGIRGDYMNLWITVDFTDARLKRGLLLGTRFGQNRASLVPAPGDPGYQAYYTRNPMGQPMSAPLGPIPDTAPQPWESRGGG